MMNCSMSGLYQLQSLWWIQWFAFKWISNWLILKCNLTDEWFTFRSRPSGGHPSVICPRLVPTFQTFMSKVRKIPYRLRSSRNRSECKKITALMQEIRIEANELCGFKTFRSVMLCRGDLIISYIIPAIIYQIMSEYY